MAVAALAACTGDIASGVNAPMVISGTGGGEATVTPVVVTMSAPQVRVLSAPEYRSTVRDLLGLTVSTNLTQSDWTAGFDNGSNIHVDDNLLAALTDEA